VLVEWSTQTLGSGNSTDSKSTTDEEEEAIVEAYRQHFVHHGRKQGVGLGALTACGQALE